jgi:histidinol-phosphatase (PHP family)
MEATCLAALARGMTEITITDHADFEPLDPCHGYFHPQGYWQAIERCRERFEGRLTILAGIECGEAHRFQREIDGLVSAHEYDFVLASLHWADSRPAWKAGFFSGLSLGEGLGLYFDELADLAARADYDVLAHPDFVRRAVFLRFGLQELNLQPHEAQLRRVLRIVAERGKGIEVNTVHLRKGMGPPGPSVQILRWFREEGGRLVTLGSDAHRPGEVGADFEQASAMAQEAGFSRLAAFRQRAVVVRNDR